MRSPMPTLYCTVLYCAHRPMRLPTLYCTVLYSPAYEVAHPVRLLEELPVLEPARAHDHLVQVLSLGQS